MSGKKWDSSQNLHKISTKNPTFDIPLLDFQLKWDCLVRGQKSLFYYPTFISSEKKVG